MGFSLGRREVTARAWFAWLSTAHNPKIVKLFKDDGKIKSANLEGCPLESICFSMKHNRFQEWMCLSKPVHGDNPEGWDGEGGRRGVQDGGHMYTHGWFISMCGKNHYNIVK